MFKFAPYLLKTLWRHRTCTALTVLGSAVALFVFTFIGSVQQGLADMTSGGDSRLIVFQANRFCPATSRMPEDYDRTIAKFSGVQEVAPIMVYTNNCRASLDAVVFHGIRAEQLKRVRDFRIVSGTWQEFEARRNGALVGEQLARRRGLTVGSTFSIGPISVAVAGIFQTVNPADEAMVYTHLEFLQRTKGLNAVGLVTQFEVLLHPGTDPYEMSRTIDHNYRGGPVQTDSRPKGVFQQRAMGDLAELINFAGYLAFACVGLVFALVATTTVMAVQDRIREHAVLQTLGYTGRRIFAFIMCETILVSVAGGLIGVWSALGALAWMRLVISAEAASLALAPSWTLALTGLIAAAGVGLFAGLAPAWQAARADIVSSLRQV